MQTSKHSERSIRYSLGILLAFVGLNALGGGYYGMTGAKGIPLEWLEGSPFHNYFIPGLFLFVVVGGSSLIAAIAVLRQRRLARKLSFTCGAIILVWLAVQINVIGYVSWLQPTTAAMTILILFLTWLLSNYKYP
jgi:hypothetical protein